MQDDFIYTKYLEKQICRDEKQISGCPVQRVVGDYLQIGMKKHLGQWKHSETAV